MASNIASMTGYGSAEGANQKIKISVQIKTVNSRFLEVRVKSPVDYYSMEPDLRKLLNQFLTRGSVDLFIQKTSLDSDSAKSVTVDMGLARSWQKACLELQKELNLSQASFEHLLVNGPHLAQIADNSRTVDDAEKDLLFETVKKAAMACQKQRLVEGENLQNHVLDLVSQIEGISKTISKARDSIKPDILNRIKAKVLPRLKEIGLEVNEDRLAQEALMLTEKMDIDEELKRLEGHIKGVRELFKQKGAIGKKFDFFIQEFFREINTLGSKFQDLAVASQVIEAKTLVERMREQGQNIE